MELSYPFIAVAKNDVRHHGQIAFFGRKIEKIVLHLAWSS